MTRLNATLLAVVAVLVGVFLTLLVRPPQPALDAGTVRSIVAEMLSQQPTQATLDATALDPMIESYLMSNPEVLDRVSGKLAEIKQAAARDATKVALTQNHDAIYNDPDGVVLGNPKGDVTLVEMFDYNCTYCRGALPDMAALLTDDPDLKIILREFPILSKESVDAARVAVLVGEDKSVDYWAFHQALFSSRGRVDGDTALDEAQKLGLNRVALQLDASAPRVAAALQKSYDLAKTLNISGTPTYILGDEIIPGALGLDGLKQRIANLRACGSTQCPAVQPPPAG